MKPPHGPDQPVDVLDDEAVRRLLAVCSVELPSVAQLAEPRRRGGQHTAALPSDQTGAIGPRHRPPGMNLVGGTSGPRFHPIGAMRTKGLTASH